MAKSSALNKITTRAKQLRKSHPKLTWIDAVKKASGEYRNGSKHTTKKVGATKMIERGESKNTPVKRVIRIERKPDGTIKSMKKVGSIPQMALTAISQCMKDQRMCENEITKLQQDLKRSGLLPAQKMLMKRDIKKLRAMLQGYKKHLSQLKKHI